MLGAEGRNASTVLLAWLFASMSFFLKKRLFEKQPQVFRLRFAPLNMTRLLEIENPEAVHSGMATTGAHATTLSASFRLRSLRDLRSR